jgi:nucleoid-associated protein YgaU
VVSEENALIPVPPVATRSTSFTPRPRTYTLEAGETLVDVARKFYGDGRVYERIFAANRDRLRHPQDVRAGLAIVLP